MIKLIKSNSQFIKFVIIGFSNLAISLLTYYILVLLNINYQIANIFAFILGSINGYFWNKKWVFKKNGEIKATLIKFYISWYWDSEEKIKKSYFSNKKEIESI